MGNGLKWWSRTIDWRFCVLNVVLGLVGLCYLTVYFPWGAKPYWSGILFYCGACSVLLTWAIVNIGAYRGNILCSTLSRVLSILFVVIFVAIIILLVRGFVDYSWLAKNKPLYDAFGSNVWVVEAEGVKKVMRRDVKWLVPLIVYLTFVIAKNTTEANSGTKEKLTSETRG